MVAVSGTTRRGRLRRARRPTPCSSARSSAATPACSVPGCCAARRARPAGSDAGPDAARPGPCASTGAAGGLGRSPRSDPPRRPRPASHSTSPARSIATWCQIAASRLRRQHLEQMGDVGRAECRKASPELALVLALDQGIHQLRPRRALPVRQPRAPDRAGTGGAGAARDERPDRASASSGVVWLARAAWASVARTFYASVGEANSRRHPRRSVHEGSRGDGGRRRHRQRPGRACSTAAAGCWPGTAGRSP